MLEVSKIDRRTINRDRKNPDVDLFLEQFFPTVIGVGAAALAKEGARNWAAIRLSEALEPLTITQQRNSNKRNAFIRRTGGLFPALSTEEQNFGAVGAALLMPKLHKRQAAEKAAEVYGQIQKLWQDAAGSINILQTAIDKNSQAIPVDLISPEVEAELIGFLIAQTETRKNRHSRPGSPVHEAELRYWQYCLAVADDRALIEAWEKVIAGQKARLKFLSGELTDAKKTPSYVMALKKELIKGNKPRLVGVSDSSEELTMPVREPAEFPVPKSAEVHIANAANSRLQLREDTYEHQMGGRFAAALSTRGVRAVTGRLPGEQPEARRSHVQMPKRPVTAWHRKQAGYDKVTEHELCERGLL